MSEPNVTKYLISLSQIHIQKTIWNKWVAVVEMNPVFNEDAFGVTLHRCYAK